jgi:hypothetical protein
MTKLRSEGRKETERLLLKALLLYRRIIAIFENL